MQNELVGAVKSHATILIEHLQRYGITIKRTQALEVISNLQAQTDWNRVKAKLSDVPVKRIVDKTPVSGLLPTCMLVSRTGSGKTEVLKTIVELETADRSFFPVFICLSGAAHIDENGLDRRLPSLSRWEIQYDGNGYFHVTKPTSSSGLGAMINFRSRARGDRTGLKEAFLAFMGSHGSNLSTKPIGSVLIDEFSRLQPEDETEVLETAARFCLNQQIPAKRLILAGQVPLRGQKPEEVDLSYVMEHDYPCFMPNEVPTQVVMPLNSDGFPPDWESESPSDPRLVADIFAQVRYSLCWRRNDGSSNSRLHHVRGNSLWFRDFRNSLV